MPKKEYRTVPVKQKNGRTVPITKLVKQCPLCGCDMFIDHSVKGGFFKRARTYWLCSETLCKHRELNEGEHDMYVRMGAYDENIGILKAPDENEFLT